MLHTFPIARLGIYIFIVICGLEPILLTYIKLWQVYAIYAFLQTHSIYHERQLKHFVVSAR